MSENVNAENLNAFMEFDVVIRVHPDGTVTKEFDENPYIELNVSNDGTDEFDIAPGWELLTGFTGQYGYRGPIMHPSEFIGGGMARHILETPGDYVSLIVNGYCGFDGETNCDEESGCNCEPAGWAVAFKPLEETPAPAPIDLGPKDSRGFYREWSTADVPREL